MSRGSFSRSVARAAASGGGRAYRARAPLAWYAVMTLICLVGISLIVYSRNERLHPVSAPVEGPSATDNWNVALGIDICGKLEPVLPATPAATLAATGIRTYGNGLINIDPGAAKTPALYEGAKATLGLFASNYPGLHLTNTSIGLPGKGQKVWVDGDTCTGPLHGPGTVVAEHWPSTSAHSGVLTSKVTGLHLNNGEMITLAFVPKSTKKLPEPNSRQALIETLGTSASSTTTTNANHTITVKPIPATVPPAKAATPKSGTTKSGTTKKS